MSEPKNEGRSQSEPKPNVIMIVCDTLRKDILDVYGGPARCPNLKEFMGDAVFYQNTILITRFCSCARIYFCSGLYPKEHKVHEEGNLKIDRIVDKYSDVNIKVLPEYLQRQGYNTIALSNNMWVSEFFGFDRGFSTHSSTWIPIRNG